MLQLYKPTLNDLWFRQSIMNDSDTMSFNHAYGGTIPFPKEKWDSWYDHYFIHHENRRIYRYLLNTHTKEFVGEVAYHYDDSRKIYLCNVIILAKHRGDGFGEIGLNLLCELAKTNGIQEIYDEIAIDNPSVGLFLKQGFVIVDKTKETVMVQKIL